QKWASNQALCTDNFTKTNRTRHHFIVKIIKCLTSIIVMSGIIFVSVIYVIVVIYQPYNHHQQELRRHLFAEIMVNIKTLLHSLDLLVLTFCRKEEIPTQHCIDQEMILPILQ